MASAAPWLGELSLVMQAAETEPVKLADLMDFDMVDESETRQALCLHGILAT